jgi:uncharacterized membrane protein YjgN (DUF898 family)
LSSPLQEIKAKKINKNKMKIQNILLKIMFYLIPVTLVVVAYSYSISALANYIFNQTAAQFLK